MINIGGDDFPAITGRGQEGLDFTSLSSESITELKLQTLMHGTDAKWVDGAGSMISHIGRSLQALCPFLLTHLLEEFVVTYNTCLSFCLSFLLVYKFCRNQDRASSPDPQKALSKEVLNE